MLNSIAAKPDAREILFQLWKGGEVGMTTKKIIDGLYFTVGMMLFNPATGEAKTPDELNEDDRYTYDACMGAIELLKAQEPRVMTLDELSEKTDVWFESLVYDTIAPALSSGSYDDGTVGLMTLYEESFYMDESDYGTKWRCWTSRPTDEQMEATPWN